MRRFHVFMLLAMAALTAAVWIAVFALIVPQEMDESVLPTRVVIPTETPSDTTTPTHTPTVTNTPTVTASPTATATEFPTLTPTLSVRVLEIIAVMPGVEVPPTATDFPFGTILLPAPPNPVEPLPDATNQPPPYSGWMSFESDNPLVRYSTPWTPRLVAEASRGQYHRSENTTSTVTFSFEGEGLRIRYVAASNMGMFDVVVDGQVIDTVDAYADELRFPGTQVYFVGEGSHTLTLRNANRRNPQSEGYVVGLDAIQVFRGTANTLILPPVEPTATPIIREAEVELLSAPTFAPSATPGVLSVSVVIAYDENGNRAVDPAEGVQGISVRVVEVGTNRAVAQAFTDAQGFAQLTLTTLAEMRVVVPYFGTVWDVGRNRDEAFTLLLAPGNQPGLIP